MKDVIIIKDHVELKSLGNGDVFKGFYILSGWNKRTKNDGGFFGKFDLSDRSGVVGGVNWNAYQGEQADNLKYEDLVGEVFYVEGSYAVNQYGKQVTANIMRKATERELEHIEGTLARTGNINSRIAYNTLKAKVEQLEEPYKSIAMKIIADNEEALIVAPAAQRIHHAYHGGLINHTLEMYMLAESITKVMGSFSYEINLDLLLTAVVAHDIMKAKEMDYNGLGIVKDYTLAGQAMGHIYMGARYIEDICRELNVDEDITIVLTSAILSHHGQLDWGSPVKPMTLEALLLHHIDLISAKTNTAHEALQGLEKGEITDRIFALDNTKLYKL